MSDHPQYTAGYQAAVADLDALHKATQSRLYEAKAAIDAYAYGWAAWTDHLEEHSLDAESEDDEAVDLRKGYEAAAATYWRCHAELPGPRQQEAEAYVVVAVDEISEETCREVPALPDHP